MTDQTKRDQEAAFEQALEKRLDEDADHGTKSVEAAAVTQALREQFAEGARWAFEHERARTQRLREALVKARNYLSDCNVRVKAPEPYMVLEIERALALKAVGNEGT